MDERAASQREISFRLEELQRYVDTRFKAQADADDRIEKMINFRFTSAEKAVEEAKDAMSIRLDRMNEFREQLASERGEYARKEDLRRLEELIRNIENEGNIRRAQERLLQWMGSTVLAAAVALGIRLLV